MVGTGVGTGVLKKGPNGGKGIVSGITASRDRRKGQRQLFRMMGRLSAYAPQGLSLL